MTHRDAVLVTGGAGYIGRHVLLSLIEAGRRVVVLDDLSTGRSDPLPPEVAFHQGTVGDPALVREVVSRHEVASVIHLAGSSVAPASIADPASYYRNNAAATLELMAVLVEAGVERLIFSSSAAVYAPSDRPLTEASPLGPSTPYGRSKRAAEDIVRDVATAHGLSWLTLRYFNVAGADAQGRAPCKRGEPTHLIDAVCQTALGRRGFTPIFGADYDTPDGTCVRDYIHVCDLAQAHLLALDDLEAGGASGVLNCGYGEGVSVKAVVEAMGALIGRALPHRVEARRPGDLASVVANAQALTDRLAWRPRHADLSLILGSALAAAERAAERAGGDP